MMPVPSLTQSRRLTDDPLAQAIDRLEHAMQAEVAGHEHQWADDLGDALTGLAAVLRRHTDLAEAPDGLLSEVDLTRPTLNRQVGELRREHRDFLDQVGDLQAQVRSAARAFAWPPREPGSPSRLPEPAPAASIPDFGVLRQQLTRLVHALRQHCDCENSLVIESVTTDLGAGD
jgi:Hemerythrin HHE cation binding domain